MGLDVHLYKYNQNKAAMDTVEAQYEKESNLIWEERCQGKKYEQLTQAEKDAIRILTHELEVRLGLDEYGSHPGKVKIELDSVKYPEHMFKVGYLRSSYNDGGLNSVLRNAGLHDLNEIFDPDDDYEFRPNWDEALARTQYVLARWRLRQNDIESKFTTFEISPNPFGGSAKPPGSEREAQLYFIEQLRKHEMKEQTFQSYSNIDGHFMLDGIKVFGLIHGQHTSFAGPRPCTYVVTENVSHKDDWYGKALEITVEMCEWVLAQDDRERYWLHWSG